ncbi:MAG: radical SAM protein [Nanoarchaeota archaeon]
MQILLVIPRYNLTNEAEYNYDFPLGLGYISSLMKKAGCSVDYLNLNHYSGAVKKLVSNQLDRKKYDIVCSGHLGIGYAVIEKIIQAVREHISKPRVIIGGCLVTSEPELMLNALKPDFEVIGEGEQTIIELLNAIKNNTDLKKVDGIGFKEKGKSVFTKPRKPIKDLDSLPYPDFEGFEFEKKLDNSTSESIYGELDNPRTYPILASRGCPFHCTFCYHSLTGGYRQRTIGAVMKEIEVAIKKWKINSLDIYDDLFSLDKKRIYEFCRRLKKLVKNVPWEFKWTCQLSVAGADKKLLQTLKDSGCSVVSFGFESYSPEVLKSMKKPITPEMIDRAIRLSMEAGIGIQGNFIFGDVAETRETAKKTLDYWKANCKGQIQLGFIQPYPGSAIYKLCIEKGIIRDKLDFIKNRISHTNWINMTDKMTDKEVLDLKKAILDARKKYVHYIIPSKLNKTAKKRYSMHASCPFCGAPVVYNNCLINNIFYYVKLKSCKKCNMRFFIVSPLYKFTVRYYQELDFLRRHYLFLRDTILKKRI